MCITKTRRVLWKNNSDIELASVFHGFAIHGKQGGAITIMR